MQGNLSAWLVKHGIVHRSLGFDYQRIETLQIKPEDWHSIAVILYVYGYNYLRSQCAYDVARGGLLASVYHLTRIEYSLDQPKEGQNPPSGVGGFSAPTRRLWGSHNRRALILGWVTT
ncbi:hypothetical protein RYX36_011935 [Vicia faba]